MTTLEEFRALLDPLLASEKSGIDQASPSEASQPEPPENLRERIRNQAPRNATKLWNFIRELKGRLIGEHVLLGIPLKPYLGVIEVIADGLRDQGSDSNVYPSSPIGRKLFGWVI